MRLGIIWHCVYPWDIRIEKFCRSMRQEGHDVLLITKGTAQLPRKELLEGISLFRIGAGALARLKALPVFFNPVWFNGIAGIARSEQLDLLIVRDLPLSLTAGLAGKRAHIPVLLDMAENYPAALLSYRKKLYQPFLFADAWLPRAYERKSLRLMDGVIVVAEEQKDRLMRLGYAEERITVVRNTPEYEELQRLGGMTTEEEGSPFPYILYSGFMDRHRGISTLIRAFAALKDDHRDLKLVLIGKGNEYDDCRKLADALHLGGRVVFKGWMEPGRIPAYIRNSTLCVIPHLKSEHTDTTIPNKLFDYLYFGKPIIVSDAAPLKRILGESGSGMVFRSGDQADLARALSCLLGRRDLPAYGVEGRRLIETKYHWRNDAAALNGLIASYARRREGAV